MDLTKLLPEHHCLLKVDADNSDGVLTNLIGTLQASGVIDNTDKFHADLKEREGQASTLIGEGVALPHARSSAVKRLGLAIAVLKDEVDADGFEGIRVVFLIAIPKLMPTCHLALLQHIARFIRNGKKLERLIGCKTPTAAVKLLTSFK